MTTKNTKNTQAQNTQAQAAAMTQARVDAVETKGTGVNLNTDAGKAVTAAINEWYENYFRRAEISKSVSLRAGDAETTAADYAKAGKDDAAAEWRAAAEKIRAGLKDALKPYDIKGGTAGDAFRAAWTQDAQSAAAAWLAFYGVDAGDGRRFGAAAVKAISGARRASQSDVLKYCADVNALNAGTAFTLFMLSMHATIAQRGWTQDITVNDERVKAWLATEYQKDAEKAEKALKRAQDAQRKADAAAAAARHAQKLLKRYATR